MKKLIYLLEIVFLLGFLGACEKDIPTLPDMDTCPPVEVRLEWECVDEGVMWEGQLWSSCFVVAIYFDGKYGPYGPSNTWMSYYDEPGQVSTAEMWIPSQASQPLVKCGIHEVKFVLERVIYPETVPAPYCQIRVKVIRPTSPYQVKPNECDFGRFQWGPDDIGAEKTFTFEITR